MLSGNRSIRKCSLCGNDNSTKAQFCGGCGIAIGEPSRDDSTIVGLQKSLTNSDFVAQSFFDKSHLQYLFFLLKDTLTDNATYLDFCCSGRSDLSHLR